MPRDQHRPPAHPAPTDRRPSTRDSDPDAPAIYEIRVKGHLGQRWSRWFSPLVITLEPNGESVLAGPIVDQAALHGILTRIRDLGLPLVSVVLVGRAGEGKTTQHRRSNKETDA